MISKKNIATITFHASHNHGSCLQAYALQEFVKKEFSNIDYRIINLRTDRQKALYGRPYDSFGAKSLLKRVIFFGYKKKILTGRENFEKFINSKLNITKEYHTLDELKKAHFKYDCYISGSDQLWNHALSDFDWSFFLEFCTGRKISYAASFGSKTEEWSDSDIKRARKDLTDYTNISVREPASADMIRKIIGVEPNINVDPTLLLEEKEWDRLIGERLIKEEYIFLYDLKGLKRAYDIAQELSRRYDLPVVIVKENSKRHLFYRFIKEYDAGPLEFLNYIKYARFVVSSSFHGTVFSTIFQKPFLAVDGSTDFRISNLLDKMGIMGRSISSAEELKGKKDEIFEIDYSLRDKVIKNEKRRSKEYLRSIMEK